MRSDFTTLPNMMTKTLAKWIEFGFVIKTKWAVRGVCLLKTPTDKDEFVLTEANCLEVESQTHTPNIKRFGHIPTISIITRKFLKKLWWVPMELLPAKRQRLSCYSHIAIWPTSPCHLNPYCARFCIGRRHNTVPDTDLLKHIRPDWCVQNNGKMW